MRNVGPQELQRWLADRERRPPVLLDVREPWEYDYCHIKGSTLLPVAELLTRFEELDRMAEHVVICHHGTRSHRVRLFLESKGFQQVYNLTGGVHAWAHEVEPSMRKY